MCIMCSLSQCVYFMCGMSLSECVCVCVREHVCERRVRGSAGKHLCRQARPSSLM